MRIEHRITEGQLKKEIVCFTYEGTMRMLGDSPSGKMITDSDALSFVYLFEDGEEYQYLHFTKQVWPLMQQLIEIDNGDPILECEDGSIQLSGFTEELIMLVFNIEGNGNYGEEFMLAVEQAFEETLQQTS
ncbi:hypothetical protein DVB69_01745 [Sporosarcina sp. BI001-red]|uniref:UPF0738 family protein n=1 Tax=Sporosarcina sp. BI001-red TaxID=2282866 RepID=UPI000E23974E|nr:hypothetical protein [Sporosarcina sp. BI001-red]REB09559.1 hypothetical protein DVB69_01745 [Sporosarcina sp. BI001-red]